MELQHATGEMGAKGLRRLYYSHSLEMSRVWLHFSPKVHSSHHQGAPAVRKLIDCLHLRPLSPPTCRIHSPPCSITSAASWIGTGSGFQAPRSSSCPAGAVLASRETMADPRGRIRAHLERTNQRSGANSDDGCVFRCDILCSSGGRMAGRDTVRPDSLPMCYRASGMKAEIVARMHA